MTNLKSLIQSFGRKAQIMKDITLEDGSYHQDFLNLVSMIQLKSGANDPLPEAEAEKQAIAMLLNPDCFQHKDTLRVARIQANMVDRGVLSIKTP